ncbi:glycosyltransferase family A protein [Vreelandella populi]|uniref:Glycosyltransferase family 2 protein n=1 Tax=Vreelandella populi TaxID=2498858 RepID=A0A3S0X2N5_9GAMM|nr:glycosyltransferase family A protein [Halomonas populi]RUR35572.1 glycosyltransferase family 2 protein [Halomonas populi]RUR47762.1 glycosyltransferase family 2 protein [Halomonas populi]RUR54375.1 glycosyltransferase family 2 protein [Halomonas populi]
MFTVIIPVHNKKEYVTAAIDSVLAQTFGEFELILIDDCSTDGSTDLIKPYESEKVTIYNRDTPGPGGYAARNLGVEKANYQWITFLDADDIWYPNHLQTAYELINKYQQVEFFSLSRDKIFKGEKSGFFHPKEEQIEHHIALERFSHKDIFHTNAVVIKKELFITAGGFPAGQCKRGGDSDLWLRLLLNCDSIVVSPIVTSCYALDNSGVIYGKASVENQHPVYKTSIQYMKSHQQGNINAALKKLSNRKNISWLVARKRSGMFTLSDLKVIYFSSLDKKGLKQLIKLINPLHVAKTSTRLRKISS